MNGTLTDQPSPRGTEGALRILINSIPHKDQRYDTCGDYYEAPYFPPGTGNVYPSDKPVENVLYLNVSRLPDRREMLLIAIHELIEWALCEAKGITTKEIDEFDLSWKPYTDALGSEYKEPGDDPQAPYYKQHQIATGIERILAAELGVDWLTYENDIEELSK